MDRAACYSGLRYASASVKTPWRSRNYDALKGTELMDKRDRGTGNRRPLREAAIREGIVKIHGESKSRRKSKITYRIDITNTSFLESFLVK